MTATATLSPRPMRRLARSGMGDEQLAGRAATGDDAAFTTLYERYHGPLLGYTRSILLDAEDARDATQNALESALRALPGRDTSRPLRPWLYKIAHNEAITIMRRRRPQSELTTALEPTVPGPEVQAEERGRLAQLVEDLGTLPERQRGALVMRELNGLSYDEIGDALGLTNEAARRAVFDARSSLHAALDGRATACVSVRRSISDGDRRSLRARGMRAHLRSCNDCASFQRAIGARRTDLHALAGWVSGAAVLGALGAGGAGGGALLAAGGGASAAGGGITWAGVPLAIKGLAVAAAVATTGTAAVEVKQVAEPERRAATAQTSQPRSARGDAIALRAAALAASLAAQSSTAATASGTRRARSARTATSTAGKDSSVIVRRGDASALLPAAAPTAERESAVTAQPTPSTSTVTPSPAPSPETAITRLGRLREQIRQVLANAQTIAAGGSQDAFTQVSGLLSSRLSPLLTSVNRVLAPFGLRLPSLSTAPTSGGLSNIFSSVQGLLGGVERLLAQLLGQR